MRVSVEGRPADPGAQEVIGRALALLDDLAAQPPEVLAAAEAGGVSVEGARDLLVMVHGDHAGWPGCLAERGEECVGERIARRIVAALDGETRRLDP